MKDLLKNARISKNLKTTEVARVLKIDSALISKFETGSRMPTKVQLVALAELLSIDLHQLEVAWLKEKILQLCGESPVAVTALQAALDERGAQQTTDSEVSSASIQKLMQEMESLKSVLEASAKGRR